MPERSGGLGRPIEHKQLADGLHRRTPQALTQCLQDRLALRTVLTQHPHLDQLMRTDCCLSLQEHCLAQTLAAHHNHRLQAVRSSAQFPALARCEDRHLRRRIRFRPLLRNARGNAPGVRAPTLLRLGAVALGLLGVRVGAGAPRTAFAPDTAFAPGIAVPPGITLAPRTAFAPRAAFAPDTAFAPVRALWCARLASFHRIDCRGRRLERGSCPARNREGRLAL